MRVALILCPSWDFAYPTYALAAFRAQLARRGHEGRIYDVNAAVRKLELAAPAPGGVRSEASGSPHVDMVEDSLEGLEGYLDAVASRILQDGCRVAGFQLYYSNVTASLRLARRLKELDPGVTIVFGGSECLTFDRCTHYGRLGIADAVLYGEADGSFPRLVDQVACGGALRGPGVLLKGDEAHWRDAQEPVPELDELPFADYSGHSLNFYCGKSLHTARGCVRRCVFCSEWGVRRYRQMSPGRVFDEIAHQLGRDKDVRSFLFADSLANGDLRGLRELSGRLSRERLGVSWHGYAIVRPDMTREVCDELAAGGCGELLFGIESGSAKVLQDAGKGTDPAWNGAVLNAATQAGIYTVAGLLVGFPTETEADFQATLDFITKHARDIGRLEPSLFQTTEMIGDFDRWGLAPGTQAMYWRTKDGLNTFPERVDRLRRIFRTAQDAGVYVLCDRMSPEDYERKIEVMLDKYERGAFRGA